MDSARAAADYCSVVGNHHGCHIYPSLSLPAGVGFKRRRASFFVREHNLPTPFQKHHPPHRTVSKSKWFTRKSTRITSTRISWCACSRRNLGMITPSRWAVLAGVDRGVLIETAAEGHPLGPRYTRLYFRSECNLFEGVVRATLMCCDSMKSSRFRRPRRWRWRGCKPRGGKAGMRVV
jgi:hypothetical protein